MHVQVELEATKHQQLITTKELFLSGLVAEKEILMQRLNLKPPPDMEERKDEAPNPLNSEQCNSYILSFIILFYISSHSFSFHLRVCLLYSS